MVGSGWLSYVSKTPMFSSSRKEEQEQQLNPNSLRFKLLSYNVNFGFFMERCKSALQILEITRKIDADIVCFQETTKVTEDYCKQLFAKDLYPHQYFYNHGGHLAGGISILCKKDFVLKKVDLLKPVAEDSKFPILIAQVSHVPSLKSFMVVGVHLRPPISLESGHDGYLDHAKAYFTTDHVRLAETKELLAEIAKRATMPVVICGDFNEGCYGSSWKLLRTKDVGYEDAIYQHKGNKTTWYWPLWGSLGPTGFYDHIFFTKSSLKAITAEIVNEYKSDHYPITAVLELL